MRLLSALTLLLFLAVPAAAQTAERLPWFAVDLHGAWVGLPSAEGWVPVVPANTPLPGRGWGVAVGATVYPLKLGPVTIGLGGGLATGKGTSSALKETTGTGPTETTKATTTTVTTQITSMVPQLSLNFGHRLGWSYLSAGYGRHKVASSSAPFGTIAAVTVPELWEGAISFGGGARWFMKPRLGAGFDVRFTRLGSRATATTATPVATTTAAPGRTRVITLSVGISIQ